MKKTDFSMPHSLGVSYLTPMRMN